MYDQFDSFKRIKVIEPDYETIIDIEYNTKIYYEFVRTEHGVFEHIRTGEQRYITEVTHWRKTVHRDLKNEQKYRAD